VSQHYEVVDKTYKRFPDGRLEALNNAAGREWYRNQTLTMARRQKWVCGLAESGNCNMPWVVMSPGLGLMTSASFEHWNKRSAGKRNDSVDPQTRNCASHVLCNSELGSRRIK